MAPIHNADQKKKFKPLKLWPITLLLLAIPVFYSSLPMEKARATRQNVSEENVQFLADIGMTNSKTLRDNVDKVDLTLRKEYLAKYGVSYFSSKGITALMKAQGLVMGDLGSYKGEIPEKNITEFKANYERLKPEELSHYYVRDSEVNYYISASEIRPELIHQIREQFNIAWAHLYLKNNKYKGSPNHGSAIVYYDATPEPIVPPAIKIVAPEKYFNMDGKEIDEDNKVVNKKPVDPMIIMEHEGGYLVLTYWFN